MEKNLDYKSTYPRLTEAESIELCGALIDYWHATDPDAYFILEFLRPIGPMIRNIDCQYWPQLFESHYKALKGLVVAGTEVPVAIKKTN